MNATDDDINEAFADAIRTEAERYEQIEAQPKQPRADDTGRVVYTRRLLKEARVWFLQIGAYSPKHKRIVLPQGQRGMKIVRWLADCTWEAYPNDPEEMLRYACGVFAPWLKPAELEALVTETHMRLKNWNGDDTATVLGVTLADHDRHGFKAIGACNDHGRTVRNERRLEKEAARKRAKRAAAGAKRGRPSSGEPWEDAGVSRRTWFRHKAEGAETGTEKASAQNLKNTSMRTGFSATKSLTPWELLGMSRATFYRLKAAGLVATSVFVPYLAPTPPGRTAIVPALMERADARMSCARRSQAAATP
jgi:hypothetical protein